MSTLSTVVVTVGDIATTGDGGKHTPDVMHAASLILRTLMTDVYTDVYTPEGGVYNGQPEGTLVVIGTCTATQLRDLRNHLPNLAFLLHQECIGLIVQGDTDTLAMAGAK